MWQVTYALLARMAAALVGHGGSPAAGPLYGVWVGLYKPPTGPVQPQSVMADITEANYDGYSRQQAVWFPPWISTSGPEQLAAQDLYFTPTDAIVQNQITGVFLADAFYGGVLLAAAIVPSPQPVLAGPSQAIKVQPVFDLVTGQVYGSPQILS